MQKQHNNSRAGNNVAACRLVRVSWAALLLAGIVSGQRVQGIIVLNESERGRDGYAATMAAQSSRRCVLRNRSRCREKRHDFGRQAAEAYSLAMTKTTTWSSPANTSPPSLRTFDDIVITRTGKA